jgi:hypothetical protein
VNRLEPAMKRIRIEEISVEDDEVHSPTPSTPLQEDPLKHRTRILHELEHKRAALARFLNEEVEGWPGLEHLPQLALSSHPKI